MGEAKPFLPFLIPKSSFHQISPVNIPSLHKFTCDQEYCVILCSLALEKLSWQGFISGPVPVTSASAQVIRARARVHQGRCPDPGSNRLGTISKAVVQYTLAGCGAT